MQQEKSLSILFVINKGSGENDTDWKALIQQYFQQGQQRAILYEMSDSCCVADIEKAVTAHQPDRLVAVGGDGTVKLVAECCMKVKLPLGILPAGSANGMAKELNIPVDPPKALENIVQGVPKKIHLTKVNDELCIHLADIGFNAFVIKKFDTYEGRGMWGYVKAAWFALRSHARMQVQLKTDEGTGQKTAAMIVIANATKYGTGALINPDGSLEDDLFEVIVVRKISVIEIFKMVVTHQPYNPAKTQVYHTSEVQLSSKKQAHFQVDGEYLGKINELKATVIPQAVEIIVPAS